MTTFYVTAESYFQAGLKFPKHKNSQNELLTPCKDMLFGGSESLPFNQKMVIKTQLSVGEKNSCSCFFMDP